MLGIGWVQAETTLRIATFNTSMNRSRAGLLVEDLKNPQRTSAGQIARVAEIIQTVRPEILFLNEVDYDAQGEGLALFQSNFLAVGQNGKEPIDYPFRYTAESNTGLASGQDLDNNRQVGEKPETSAYAGDAFGFGAFPGQYGMAILSKHPIEVSAVRTFQHFLWNDMPGALLPNGRQNSPNWYTEEESAIFRLSSKSHWDVPIRVGDQLIHLLVSHPTPPVFDGQEDRNGRRNHDEIRLWADFIDPDKAHYIYDDNGLVGGLQAKDRFIIMGDLNADPNDGDSYPGTANQLLEHPLVNTTIIPTGPGGTQVADRDHHSDPASDTADFRSGNLRADYALPSKSGWDITKAAVFWPETTDSISATVRGASDHRLVYLDLTLGEISPTPPVRELVLTRSDERVELRWKPLPNQRYEVAWSDDLKTLWNVKPPLEISVKDGHALAVDNKLPTFGKRFYRVTAKKR